MVMGCCGCEGMKFRRFVEPYVEPQKGFLNRLRNRLFGATDDAILRSFEAKYSRPTVIDQDRLGMILDDLRKHQRSNQDFERQAEKVSACTCGCHIYGMNILC